MNKLAYYTGYMEKEAGWVSNQTKKMEDPESGWSKASPYGVGIGAGFASNFLQQGLGQGSFKKRIPLNIIAALAAGGALESKRKRAILTSKVNALIALENKRQI